MHAVLLVEDDPNTREYLARAVADHPELELIAGVGTGAAARAILAEQEPRVLLTDLGLPDGDGIEIIREVRARYPGTEIMVITVFGDERHVVGALEAGATGYVLKDSPPEDIGQVVVDLVAGGSPISPPIARYLLKRFQRAPAADAAAPAPATDAPRLTEREVEVLKLIAKAFSYAEIAELMGISAHTVTTHIKNLYRKLAVHSRSEAVFEAVQMGIIDLKES